MVTTFREWKIVLPRRVRPQPTPNMYPGGDCVACVIAGVSGKTVPEIYEIAKQRDIPQHESRWKDGKVDVLTEWDAEKIFDQLEGERVIDHVVWDVPVWPWAPALAGRMNHTMATFGLPGHMQASAWMNYMRMAFTAGYYGLAGVDMSRKGPVGEGSNHWVLLCGMRARIRSLSGGASTLDTEILVSCSARSTPDEEWVKCHGFLRDRGGFSSILVRPREK